MSASLISPEMHDAVGRVYERMVSYPVSASDVRRWVIATYYPQVPPAGLWDEAVAANGRYGSLVAPHEFNPFAWIVQEPRRIPPRADGADVNGVELVLGIAPPATKNGLNGGLEVEYGDVRMHLGDVITSETAVESYEEKSGRMGVMLMTRLLSTWTNQNGDVIKRSRQTIIRY